MAESVRRKTRKVMKRITKEMKKKEGNKKI